LESPNESSPASGLETCTKLELELASKQPNCTVRFASPDRMLQQYTPLPSAGAEDMAYQRVDPHPFAPQGFQPMVLQHREMMVKAVTRNQPLTHEDYAIISIHLLLLQPLHFLVVWEIVQEFLEEHMNVRIREIQKTHLGQALVRFVHAHDRDLLIHTSPHPYGDVTFSLV
jgi:hypothetical protein